MRKVYTRRTLANTKIINFGYMKMEVDCDVRLWGAGSTSTRKRKSLTQQSREAAFYWHVMLASVKWQRSAIYLHHLL